MSNRVKCSRLSRISAAGLGVLALLLSPALGEGTAEAQGKEPEPAKQEVRKEKEEERKGDDTEKMGGEHRHLNGHNFITPTAGHSAMINGALTFAQGGGATQFEGWNATTGKQQASTVFHYGQQFLLQVGILNRVGIDVTFGGTAAVGGDVNTLLILGALANVNAGVMPRVRLLTVDSIGLQLSAGVGALYSRSILVSPGQALQRAAATGSIQNLGDDLVRQSSSFNVNPAVMAAWGWKPIGLQVSAGPTIGVAGDGKRSGLMTDVHFNFDLRRVTPVPFAVTFEYRLDYDFTAKAMAHTLAPGVWYSGRRDFNLGTIVVINPPVAGDPLNLESVTGQMSMQYFF